MEYSKIIAITGLPGLFELISSKSDGGIVRSLDDKSTRFVSSRVHQFSHLESIEVYTTRHNVNLVDVLKAMEASKEKLPDEKDPAALKSYFEKVFSELDFDRVYTSDLKKMVKWYAVLEKNQVEIKLSEAPAEEEAVEVKEEKPAKKPAPSQPDPKTTEEKAPAKKAAETKPAEVKSAKKPAASKPADSKTAKKAAEKKEVAKEKTTNKESAKKAAPAKEVKKPAAKPAAKPASKPASKPAAKPAAKKK
jgi:Domain of unknown function (DUF5606)